MGGLLTKTFEKNLLYCLVLALLLPHQAIAAGCGPTYGADGIAVDTKGDVWFTHFEDARIGRLSSEGLEFREYLASAKANPVVTTQTGRVDNHEFDYSMDNGFNGIALDEKNGFLWTVRFSSNRLARFSLQDAGFEEFTFRAQLFHTRGPLPMGPDGSLWLLIATPAANGLESGGLVHLSATGEFVEEFAVPSAVFVSPVVAVDATGRPWLALTPAGDGGARLYTLDSGSWSQRDMPDVGRFITGMVFDRQETLWLAAPEKNAIARFDSGGTRLYPVPTANAFPQQVFVDPEKNRIWFTEWNGHRIGTLSDTGAIREYVLPAEEESPLTLAFAKDGSVWFSSLFNYGLFRLDPRTGNTREYAVPVPSNWFGDASSTFSSCSVPSREAVSGAVDASPLKPSRHPRGYFKNTVASLFEKSCNTQCHSWYRVDKVAKRRSDWAATVDRMIWLNGAKSIGEREREQIIRYLNDSYAAKKDGKAR
jgi:streptogramin lyase